MNEIPVTGNTKIKNLNEKHDVSNAIGNIEDLPEGILGHMLSLLPLKDAVKTSLLSKKWQCLWKFIPGLAFDDKSYSNREHFISSVERVILLHDHAAIRRFCLQCEACTPWIDGWITKVVKQNVEECSIMLTLFHEDFVLPQCLFTCNTLTRLCLQMKCTLRLPPRIHLPSLKFLSLYGLTFSDANSIQQLFSSPALVELKIDSCCWVHLGKVSISALKLKTLIIDNDRGTKDGCCQVVIQDCNLHFFSVRGLLLNDYSVSNSSVQVARLNVYQARSMALEQVARRLSKILQGLHVIQSLYLGSMTIYLMEGVQRCGLDLPVFHNMKFLEFDKMDTNMLGRILQCTPHLQILHLNQGLNASYGEENDQKFDHVPSCFLSSLRKIRINMCFRNGELFAMKNLLGCAFVLERLEIWHCLRRNMTEADLQRELLNDVCGLKNCEIAVLDCDDLEVTSSKRSSYKGHKCLKNLIFITRISLSRYAKS